MPSSPFTAMAVAAPLSPNQDPSPFSSVSSSSIHSAASIALAPAPVVVLGASNGHGNKKQPVAPESAPVMGTTYASPAAGPVSSSTTNIASNADDHLQQMAQIYTTVATSLAHANAAPFILVPTSLLGGATMAANTNAFQVPIHALSQQLPITTTASGALVEGGQVMTLIPCSLVTGPTSQAPVVQPPATSLAFSPFPPVLTTTDQANSTHSGSAHASPVSTRPGSPLLAPTAAALPASLSVPQRHPRPDDDLGDSPHCTTAAPHAPTPVVTPPKLKRQRTRKTYSFTEKAQALDQLAAIRASDPSISVERASRQVRINGLPIPDSTLHSWIADQPAIRKAASETAKSTVRRCAGTILGTLLEEAIAEWARSEVEASSAKPAGSAAVTCPGLKIQQCARMVAKKKAEKLKALGKPVSALLDAFCGSDGWLDRFKTRWGIKWNGTAAAAGGGINGQSSSSVAKWTGIGVNQQTGDREAWTDEKWDAVIDRVIAIECGMSNQADAARGLGTTLVKPTDASSTAVDVIDKATAPTQAVPSVNCIMPPSSSSFAFDSDSAGEDALSFLLNYSDPKSSASTADVCDCGTVSAAAAATTTPPDGQSRRSSQQSLGALAELEELALTPPALGAPSDTTATFSAPQAMSTFTWFTASSLDSAQPPSSSTVTPIPLQQLLSIPLLPNESASITSASAPPSCLSFHSLPQFQREQHQEQLQQAQPLTVPSSSFSYASSSMSCSPPSSSPFALAPQGIPQLFSSPPSSPSGAFSAVNTFHGLHAHYVGTREWDVVVLEAAREILARNGEWVSSEEGGLSDPRRCG